MNEEGGYLKRPFAVIGAVFLLVSWFLSTFGISLFTAVLPIVFIISALLVIFRFRKRFIVFLLIFITALSAFLCFFGFERDYKDASSLSGKDRSITATVLETPLMQEKAYLVRINSIDGMKTSVKARLSLDKSESDEAGLYDTISCRANLFDYSDNKDIEKSFKSEGIYLSGFALKNTLKAEKNDSPPLMYYIMRLKYSICNGIYSILPNDFGGFIIAVVLGEKAFVSDTVIEDFKICGISHLMAVSGLHTYIWSGFLVKFLSLFMSRRKSSVFAIVFLVFFMMLTGFTPSVVRAGIMMICLYSGNIFRRRPDSLNSLGLSLFVILLINPFAAVNIGLLLSYSAALGLVLLSPGINRVTLKVRNRNDVRYFSTFLGYIVSIILVSLTATLFTLPVSVFYLGRVSLLSVVSNILAVDLGMFIMIFGGISLIFYPFAVTRFITYPFLFVAGIMSKLLLNAVSFLSQFDFLYIDISSVYFKVFIAGGLLSLLMIYIFKPALLKNRMIVIPATVLPGLILSMISVAVNY